MRLPNGDKAIVPLDRLESYLLNPGHGAGKHKARVFQAALGIGAADAPFLKSWLIDLARDGEAQLAKADEYGQRFVIRAKLSYKGREALVRTAWIIRVAHDEPEFLTAFVE